MKRIVCSVVLIAGVIATDDASAQSPGQPNDEPAKQSLQPGDAMPDVVLYDMNNQPVNLANAEGKRVLICTWASW